MKFLLLRLALPILLTLFGLYRLYEYYNIPQDLAFQREHIGVPLGLTGAGILMGIARYVIWKKRQSA